MEPSAQDYGTSIRANRCEHVFNPGVSEKPYYLVPDGEEADEGYTVIRQALAETRKVAIGQLIMQGREHLVGIKPLGRVLALYILRYADEPREPTRYFESITAEPKPEAIALAAELIARESGRFEPEKIPGEYAAAIHEMIPRSSSGSPR